MEKKSCEKTGNEKKSNSISRYFKKVKKIYTNSSSFFRSVENQDFFGLMRFVTIFYLIFFALSMLVNLVLILILGKEILYNLGFLGSLLSIIKMIILGFVGFFVQALIILFMVSILALINKCFLKLTKVKAEYLNSFKPLVYSLILILGYIFVASYVLTPILQAIFPVDYSYLEQMNYAQDINVFFQSLKSLFIQPTLFITGIVTLLGIIHGIIFAIKGIAKFNKVSKLKSSVGIILSFIIEIVIILLLLVIISSGPAIG